MRVIVCGGRDYNDDLKVHAELSAIHRVTPIMYLFHGNARGADTLAAEWGFHNSVHVHPGREMPEASNYAGAAKIAMTRK